MAFAGPDADLFYEEAGEGYPILLIPGFGGIGSFWKRQIAYFSRHYRTVTFDHRGTGESARSRIVYSIDQMEEDARCIMDAAGIERAVIIGHSTGGAIAQKLAARCPDRVAGAVLSCTWLRPGDYFQRVFRFRRSLLAKGEQALYHQAGIFFLYPPSYLEGRADLFDGERTIDPEITLSRIDAVLQADLSAYSDSIRVPTLVVAARDDSLVPNYMSIELARCISDAKYVELDHGGHFLPETACAQYNQLIEDFLKNEMYLGASDSPPVSRVRQVDG